MNSAESSNRGFESIWFWASLFSMSALVALVLMEPKFQARQPQLERKFQARQFVAENNPSPTEVDEEPSVDPPRITLRPLYVVMTVLLAFTWGMWLRQRFSPPA